jgi:hypothetical protein
MKFKQRKFIEEVRSLETNYKSKNFEKICRFLLDEQLFHIQDIPFRWIVNDYLRFNIKFGGKITRHSIVWHYTADFKLIKGWTTYSFRFPNFCDWDLYETFNVNGYPVFSKSTKPRHRSDDWYVYTGKNLLEFIGQYLHIQNVVQVDSLPIIKLFINQVLKRIDIYCYFKSINTKITITFEQGSPEYSSNY